MTTAHVTHHLHSTMYKSRVSFKVKYSNISKNQSIIYIISTCKAGGMIRSSVTTLDLYCAKKLLQLKSHTEYGMITVKQACKPQ